MKTRVFSSLVLVPVLLVVFLILPIWAAAVVVGLMCAVASYELLHNTGMVTNIRLTIYSAVMAFGVSIWSYYGCPNMYLGIGILCFYVLIFAEMMRSGSDLQVKDALMCMFGAFLVPYMLSALVRILQLEQGRIYIFVPFLLAFLSDTGAYFVGLSIGKHKLCPTISPKKTVEGFVGGIVMAIAGMITFSVLVTTAISPMIAIILGLLGSIGGVFGDLSMSVIKRQCGIKDYGKLIPGHGGILDRFDSVLITAPLTELFLIFVVM